MKLDATACNAKDPNGPYYCTHNPHDDGPHEWEEPVAAEARDCNCGHSERAHTWEHVINRGHMWVAQCNFQGAIIHSAGPYVKREVCDCVYYRPHPAVPVAAAEVLDERKITDEQIVAAWFGFGSGFVPPEWMMNDPERFARIRALFALTPPENQK